MFTRATTAEVGTSNNQDIRVTVDTLVKDEIRVLLAVSVAQLEEGRRAETSTLDGLQELLGNDGVGVDIRTVQRSGNTLKGGELGKAGAAATATGGGVGVRLVVSGEIQNAVKLVLGLGGLSLGLHINLGLDLREDRTGDDMLANVGELADNSGSGGHGRGHQMGTTLSTLATLEVTVRGTGTALLRRENVWVHTETHGATGLTPFKACIFEDLVEAFTLSLLLDQARSRDDHSTLDVLGNLLALNNLGRGPQILDTSVGARSDENLVHGDLLHGGTRGKTHVFQSPLAGGLPALVLKVIRARNNAVDRDHILGRGTPGDGGDDVLGIQEDIDVVLGVRIGLQGRPEIDRLLPLGTAVLGSKGTALQVFKGDLVRCDHACTGTALNRHVAHRHTGLDTETPDDGSTELNDGTSTTSSSNHTNNVEDDILAGDTGVQLAVNLDAHVLASAGQEGLCGENVLDFTCSDTESEGAKGTMCGGVAVTADNGCSGKSETLLGANDVNNTLALVAHAEVGEAEILDILLEGGALKTGVVLLDEVLGILEVFAGRSGNVLYSWKKERQ